MRSVDWWRGYNSECLFDSKNWGKGTIGELPSSLLRNYLLVL